MTKAQAAHFAGARLDTRGKILSSDLTVDNNNIAWWRSNHVGTDDQPIGFNRLYTDGSVRWVKFADRLGQWFQGKRTFYY